MEYPNTTLSYSSRVVVTQVTDLTFPVNYSGQGTEGQGREPSPPVPGTPTPTSHTVFRHRHRVDERHLHHSRGCLRHTLTISGPLMCATTYTRDSREEWTLKSVKESSWTERDGAVVEVTDVIPQDQ